MLPTVTKREIWQSYKKQRKSKRKQREKDKSNAQENKDSTFLAARFDLEEVLMTPKAFESSQYYKRRLNTFNFSIYDLGQVKLTATFGMSQFKEGEPVKFPVVSLVF